jgi:hypothetical protein
MTDPYTATPIKTYPFYSQIPFKATNMYDIITLLKIQYPTNATFYSEYFKFAELLNPFVPHVTSSTLQNENINNV